VSCIINSADALSYRDASDAAPAAAAAVNVLSSSNYDFVPIFFARSLSITHVIVRPTTPRVGSAVSAKGWTGTATLLRLQPSCIKYTRGMGHAPLENLKGNECLHKSVPFYRIFKYLTLSF